MSANSNEYVPVYSANGKLAAEIVRLSLEAQGIPAIISQESVGETYGLTMTPTGQVDVLVPSGWIDEATQIINDMEAGRLETNVDLSGGETVDDSDIIEDDGEPQDQ